MSSKNVRRLSVAFALALALALLPATAHAAPRSGPAGGPASFAAGLLDLLAGIWSGLERAWGGSGMTIDPDGLDGSSQSGGDDDNGMSIDPHGNSAEGEGDEGMSIDPHG